MDHNLRSLIEEDLGDTLEEELGTPIVLIDPNGNKYAYSKNNPALPLYAQVLYDYTKVDGNGLEVVVHQPRISVRRSSLPVIPGPGERWAIQFPKDPFPGSPMVSYVLGKPAEGGRSIGFLTYYPTKGANSGDPQ